MRILLIGNGVNLALSSNYEKYNLLEGFIPDFLIFIKYQKIDEKTDKDNFDFNNYIIWLGKPSISNNEQKLFNFYSRLINSSYKNYDLELIIQLYITSLKFQNSSNTKKIFLNELIN